MKDGSDINTFHYSLGLVSLHVGCSAAPQHGTIQSCPHALVRDNDQDMTTR